MTCAKEEASGAGGGALEGTGLDAESCAMRVIPRKVPKPFLLLERVSGWSEKGLEARVIPVEARPYEVWELLEAMGQAACLHQRVRGRWQRQAFVLSCPRMAFESLEANGRACVHAELLTQAASAASYAVRVESRAGEKDKARLLAQGELAVGLMDWPDRNGEEAGEAEQRSRETWRWLTGKASKIA